MIEVKFDTTNSSGGIGSLSVSHMLGNEVPVGNITGTITDPAQGIIGVNTPSNVTLNLSLPLDVNGNIIYGVYEINLTFDGVTYTGSYKVCNRRATDYELSADIYCLLGIAEIKDNGPYVNGAIIDRVFRIRRPAVQTFDEEAREDEYATKQRSSMRIEVGYGGVDYTMDVSGTVEASINPEAALQVLEVFKTSSITKMADCRKSLCKLSDCINTFARNKEAKGIACGTGMTSSDSLVVMRVMLLFSRLMAAIDCLDIVLANTLYEDIERIVGSCVCDTGDNTPIRIGFDVAIGLARRNPITLISRAGTSQNVSILEGGRVEISNDIELDELAGRVIRKGGSQVDLNLLPPDWLRADILPEFKDSGLVGITTPYVSYRTLPSLGGFVQIYGIVTSTSKIYSDDTVITSTPLPASLRLSDQDSIMFPLFDDRKIVVGSAWVRSDGHIVLKTATADPGGNPALEDETYFFSMNYDPSLNLVFIDN